MPVPDGGARERTEASERAIATFDAVMGRGLYSRRTHLFGTRTWPLGRSYEHLWPYANAWSALCALATMGQEPRALSALPGFLEGLGRYSRLPAALDGREVVGFESTVVPPLGSGGDVFYDDNAWLALALLRHHHLLGDERARGLARRLFQFVISGWSEDSTWKHPGGIRWKEPASNRSRNACSNAPVAELGALLGELGEDTGGLGWALRIYEWVRSALLGDGGLYLDHVAPDGSVDAAIWSYNQGTMIGAGVLLHRLTGDGAYLAHANATASACLERYQLPELLRQDVAFNAVYFRNLLLLDGAAPNPSYRESASAYADLMWEQRRDPASGLFRGGASPLNNSAPMIEIYAILAGAPALP